MWAKIGAILLLLLLSAFFASSETAMMALNRHRLRYLVSRNAFGARRAQNLLARPDRLLSLLLIGNNLINTVIPVLTTSLTLALFGSDNLVLGITTGVVALLIIIFAEIAPKIVGATFPEKIALPASVVLTPLMRIGRPLVWLTNSVASLLLRLLHIDINARENRLTLDEIRAYVLESSVHMPAQSRGILTNLFDLQDITVEDVMVPRPRLQALDIRRPLDALIQEIENSQHSRLVVYDGDINRVLGTLHVRRTLPLVHRDALDLAALKAMLAAPYFVPAGTPVFQQLQFFQENQQRMGIVVDEYGDVQGIVTPRDIVEELTGEFASSLPSAHGRLSWDAQGCCVVPGGITLRELNRMLSLHLPLDGPNTLNGLILERLTEIPAGEVCLTVENCRIEVMQIDHQTVRTARLTLTAPSAAPAVAPRRTH